MIGVTKKNEQAMESVTHPCLLDICTRELPKHVENDHNKRLTSQFGQISMIRDQGFHIILNDNL